MCILKEDERRNPLHDTCSRVKSKLNRGTLVVYDDIIYIVKESGYVDYRLDEYDFKVKTGKFCFQLYTLT